MNHEPKARPAVSAQEVQRILDQAMTEPGVNDMMALLELSAQANAVYLMCAALEPMTVFSQSTDVPS